MWQQQGCHAAVAWELAQQQGSSDPVLPVPSAAAAASGFGSSDGRGSISGFGSNDSRGRSSSISGIPGEVLGRCGLLAVAAVEGKGEEGKGDEGTEYPRPGPGPGPGEEGGEGFRATLGR